MSAVESERLPSWMHWVLRIAAANNLIAGVVYVVFYHECFELLGIEKPVLMLPFQLVGMLVFLFGIGYLIVDRNPFGNGNVLLLGMLSKLGGSILAIGYIVVGQLPVVMLLLLFLADLIYLLPFFVIWRRINATRHIRSG